MDRTTSRPKPRAGGFSLVVSVALLSLLALLAVGLLGLSSVSLRTSSRQEARRSAEANARVALVLAIGQLQRELGPDTRVSAPAAILDGSPETPALDGLPRSGEMVGVWDAWSPRMRDATDMSNAGPDYAEAKGSRFRRWLASSPDPTATAEESWIRQAPGDASLALFTTDRAGFEMRAEWIPSGDNGALAWATVQENTKARLLPGGYHGERWAGNDALMAPGRTGFELSDALAAADGDDAPALFAKLVSAGEVALSELAGPAYDPATVEPDFSVHARGLLTNVVDGGLRHDLTSAFEMPESAFNAPRLGQRDNPFVDAGDPRFGGERVLFEPGSGFAPEVFVEDRYGTATVQHYFKNSHLPTFTTLRSHYRTWRHLYPGTHGLTARERRQSGAAWPDAAESVQGVMPVLDRVLFFLQAAVRADGTMQLLVTPIVTLWNPYNTAIDCEGFTVYPWLDFPVNITWNGEGGTGDTPRKQVWLSNFLSSGDTGEGRTRVPYFLLKLTADGSDSPSGPIPFAPGEVRVFSLVNPGPQPFLRTAGEDERKLLMKPVDGLADLNTEGGLLVPMDEAVRDHDEYNYRLKEDARIRARLEYTRDQHKYYVVMEDLGRWQGREPFVVANVQVDSGGGAEQAPESPWIYYEDLIEEAVPLGVLETFHRTARGEGGGERRSDLAFTNNPLQRDATSLLTGTLTRFESSPHVDATLRGITDIIGSGLEITLDGRRSYYGESNSAATGRERLSFVELPRSPLVSLASLQHADLSASVYAPMNQFGNSWASPYVMLDRVHMLMRTARPMGADFYDSCYLANEALWDSCFFSGLAPEFSRSGGGGTGAWDRDMVTIRREAAEVARGFMLDPADTPGRVARFRPWRGERPAAEVADRVAGPEAPLLMAAHLMVDGAFNVNSTRVEAWKAMLAANRGLEFEAADADGGDRGVSSGERTPLPRMQHPTGEEGDAWFGFRSLDDRQVTALAEALVEEVKRRGPFQSLGEFVNRRIENSDLGRTGAVQAAIDRSGINDAYLFDSFDTRSFRLGSNLSSDRTGVGIPGYLTQADLLQPLAPALSVRSDCFVVRAAGEARDADGALLARAVCEAVVQRVPELIDSSQDAALPPADWNPVNERFGRRLRVVSMRWLSPEEIS